MIFDYKGIEVFYNDYGNGPVVLLLHGFIENTTMWNTIALELSKKNRVLTIDLLGHGQTGCLGYIHTMESMADVVHALLDQLKLRRVTLIGHSMGGYVGLCFAKSYERNLKGLCLLNSTAQSDSEERKKLRLRACKLAQHNYEGLLKMSISNLFGPQSSAVLLKDIESVKQDALRTPLQGYMAAAKGMCLRENQEQVLKTIPKRLFIAGDDDPILSLSSLKAEARRTETPIVTVPHGHMSHIESKTLVIRYLKEFLNS